MKDLQKLGGAAAWVDAATYLIVMGLLFTFLSPMADGSLEIGQFVAFAADKQPLIFVWNFTAYIINGIFLVILMLALHERLKAGSPGLVQAATVFGLIWAALIFAAGLIDLNSLGAVIDLYGKDPAQAATFKLIVDAVVLGINSSDRLAGGLWILLISWAALRSSGLPRALNYLGLVIAVASLVSTTLPFLKEAGTMFFGLGIIVWWVWLGLVMLRGQASVAASRADALTLHHRTANG